MSSHPIHLCVGAPRAGTTWLFREIREHQSIFVPLIKEVRYWNSRRTDNAVRKTIENIKPALTGTHDENLQTAWLERWQEIQRSSPVSWEQYQDLMAIADRPSIDISPTYCFLPLKHIQLLRQQLPTGSKVLYFLRDPLDRLSSQVKLRFHMHGHYRGNPSEEDLAQFLSNDQQRKRWDYATIIENWRGVFGTDFKVVRFNDVVNDPRRTISRLSTALDFDLVANNDDRAESSFHHREKNQNLGEIWPSTTIVQKRKMAQSILPEMSRFADTMPKPGNAWLKKINRLAETDIDRQEDDNSLPLPVQKLMRMCESIGDNCEYGFWQRHRGYNPSSLFRWAITPVNHLISYLESPRELYEIKELSPHTEGMVTDSTFGFKFHSKLVEKVDDDTLSLLRDQDAFDTIYAREKAKIDYLTRRFFSYLKNDPGVYILKDHFGTELPKIERVAELLSAHNSGHKLLWVVRDPEAALPPQIGDVAPNILKLTLPGFAPYADVSDYYPGGWTSAMTELAKRDDIGDMISNMTR